VRGIVLLVATAVVPMTSAAKKLLDKLRTPAGIDAGASGVNSPTRASADSLYQAGWGNYLPWGHTKKRKLLCE
jgi:hypothetical protein